MLAKKCHLHRPLVEREQLCMCSPPCMPAHSSHVVQCWQLAIIDSFAAKKTRITTFDEAIRTVGDFMREKRMNRERVTAREVLDCLVHFEFLSVERNNDDQS